MTQQSNMVFIPPIRAYGKVTKELYTTFKELGIDIDGDAIDAEVFLKHKEVLKHEDSN